MDAIVTAGGLSRPNDPLYVLTGIEKKALIPLAGQPMIAWVVGALFGSGLIDHIVIVGLRPADLPLNGLPLYFVDAVGSLIDNIMVALAKLKEINPAAQKVLLASSDIPLITPESIRGFVAECGSLDADIYYAIVEEKTMEASFPDSRRTFVPFKGGRYSGGDVFLADILAPDKTDLDLFRALTGSRKNYWQQARLLGFGFIIRFLLRQLTVADAAKRAGKTLNLDARGIDTRYPELGMDLDKPRQYELIKAILEERQAQLLGSR
ncbi:MAG: NTP transferase domain-containing protein [Chloroflexota bacterium]